MTVKAVGENRFEITTHYKITYETEYPVPIPEVIDSLQSLDRILRRTPRFIEAALPGIKIIQTDVLIEKIESGSLKDNFLVRFLFEGNEENIDQFQECVDKLMANGSLVGKLVAFAVGGMMMYSVMQLIPDGSNAPNINAYNNTIINIGGEVGLESESVKTILKAIPDKKSLARDSVTALSPAHRDPNADITFEEYPDLSIPAPAVAEAPKQYQPLQPTEQQLTYEQAQILIRAGDADSRDKVWAGTVPGITDKRTKFIIGDNVDPEELYGKTTVYADIRITQIYRKSQQKYAVTTVEILRLYK